ncbi:MAG: GNAT family N-acetyltransferase [Bacteroidales bacterium]|nr:GNAT family N-acetyltransferase [Bacteroidales bacterium]
MVGKKVTLRALEPSDLPLLYEWENAPANWVVSGTTTPFSQHTLQQYIDSPQDLFLQRQLRLMVVENESRRAVGTVDIFDFDSANQRAGLGILIAADARRRGYGLESIRLATDYLFTFAHVHQVYCNIMTDNPISIGLFQKAGFEVCGRKRDWICTADGFCDELMLQHLHPDRNNQSSNI